MINIKKIGMTALAASLVSTSVFAASLSVKGATVLNVEGFSTPQLNKGKDFTQTNSITMSGTGELENGLKVSLSYELDQDDAANTSSPFDDHSITLSSDALGKLVFHGHGGKSASTNIDSTVAGDIWDNFDSGLVVTGVDLLDSNPGEDSFLYTLPSMVEGLSIFASYSPGTDAAGTPTDKGYGLTYAGIEGLSASYAQTDIKASAANLSGDQKAYKISYAYGPITAGYSLSKYKVGAGTDADRTTSGTDAAQDGKSYQLSYSLNEAMSISYGIEKFESPVAGDEDAEFAKISAAYTVGGVTYSAGMTNAENIDYTTSDTADVDSYNLNFSFNF